MEQPSVSIVIPTLNSSRILEDCLQSIRSQDYPQEKMEILVVDGGSTDETETIAARYGCRFINGGYRDNQEARKGLGLHQATGKLVAYIDSDNILPNTDWLQQMVQPFLDNPNVVGSETWRYGLKEGFSPFNRYCALLGANDPVVFYLGKCEKLSWLYDEWRSTKIGADRGGYFLANFDESNLPTLGGNGFLVRRELLFKSRCQPDEFFHIDVVLDLVHQGYNTFAMVRNEIYHNTAAKLSGLAARRVKYFKAYNPTQSNRRYFIFNPRRKEDVLKLILFVFYTLTLVEPLLFSLRGFVKKRDVAWFLHPLVCLSFLFAYSRAAAALCFRKFAPRPGQLFQRHQIFWLHPDTFPPTS